jgi:phosphatidylglycerol:prolipoprotein diacylglycerol transferase
MHPQLWGSLRAYPVFLLAAIFVGSIVAVAGARRAGVEMRRFVGPWLFLNVPALLGAKLYGLLERPGVIAPLGTELFAGYRYPGGVIGIAVGLLILRRWGSMPPWQLADIIAPAFGFAMATVRIGCLLAGCCAGTVCTLPWAIRFPGHSLVSAAQVRAGILASTASASLPVHPLQVYFAFLGFGLGCFCLWFQRRKAYDGQVFLIYVTAYGIGQFLLEFLRFGPLPHVQYMALAVALAAGAALVAKATRPQSKPRVRARAER